MYLEFRVLVTIVSLGRLRITIYADDHHPPHFHVISPDEEVMVRLSDLHPIAGRMRGSLLRPALDWARANIGVLEDEWKRLNGR